MQEVVERAQLGSDGFVTARLGTDGVRTAGVAWPGYQAIVGTFALGDPDRVNRGHVQRVETHRCDCRQARLSFAEGRAAGWVGALRTRKHLVPRRETRGGPVDDELQLAPI